jgi:YggT family protein
MDILEILIRAILAIRQILVVLVIVSVILSYFVDPYHPVRRGIDRIVEPMLSPIRRVVPLVGMLDFSPIVLIILIQVVANLLVRLLSALR